MQLTCNLQCEGLALILGSRDRCRRAFVRALVGICRRKIVNFPLTDDPSSVPSNLIFEDGCTGLPSLRHVTVTEFSAVHVKTTRSPSVTMRSLGTETSRWPTARKSENNSQKNSSSSAPSEKRMLHSSTRALFYVLFIFSTLQTNSMKLRSRRFLNSESVSKSRL